MSRERGRPIDAAYVAYLVGLLACLTAVVAGVVLASRRVVVPCPDEKVFAVGTTDPNCYAHPKGWLGIAVVALSVALAALVALVHSLHSLHSAARQSPPG